MRGQTEFAQWNQELQDHLQNVESFLMANIALNFDEFQDSINQLWEMEVEMSQISKSIKMLKSKNTKLRQMLIENNLKVYFLNRRKVIMKQIWEHLKLLKILKESIPVVWNLIENGSDFDTAMKLMDNAFTLIN